MALNNMKSCFDDIIAEIHVKEEELKRLAALEDRTLIKKLKVRSNKLIEDKGFQSIERVFVFNIDSDLNYQTSKPLPKLKSDADQLKCVDLEVGYGDDGHQMIVDYPQYWDKKWQYFHKAIDDNELIRKHEPQFVSFSGPLADVLSTGCDTGITWKMMAQMRNGSHLRVISLCNRLFDHFFFTGVIYLMKRRNEWAKNGHAMNESNRRLYCGLNLLHMITDGYDDRMSEKEKYFAVNVVHLDSYKLLTLNEIKGVDGLGNAIDVNLCQVNQTAREQQFFNRKRSLRLWAKTAIAGVVRLFIGNIKHNNFLVDIEGQEVSQMAESNYNNWSEVKCIDFLRRFLAYVKSCVTEEEVVYELEYIRGSEYVTCNQLNPNFLDTVLPKANTECESKDIACDKTIDV